MNLKSKLSALVLTVAVFASLLAGCGQGKPAGETPGSNTGGNGPAKEAAFTYLMSQAIVTIDPAQHTDEASMISIINMYDPLVYPKDAEGSMEPGAHVAEKWDVSPDGTTYTFKIRSGIKFHDGTELTAEDVVFSMQRMLAMKKGYSWLWNGVLQPENVKALDPSTVEFKLDQPYAPFLATLEQFFIVNKKLVMANKKDGPYGEYGDYGAGYLDQNDAGSGPYTVKSLSRDSELVLDQFKDYWKGWKAGQVEKAYLKVVKEQATQKAMIKSGQADMIDQWHSVATYAEMAKDANMKVDESPTVQLYHVTMNTQRAPFDDIHFRKAVALAFDYQTAVDAIFGGAVIAQGPVPNKTMWHNGDVKALSQNLEEARKELALSKYKPGDHTLEFMFVSTQEQQRKVGLLLQQNLKELGIQVELKGVQWANITQVVQQPDTTPHLVSLFDTLKYPHPDSHTYGMYHPSAFGSYRSASWLEDDELTKTLEAARKATDLKEQETLYQKVQALAAAQHPSLFVANPTHHIAMRKHVNGYRYVGLLGFDINVHNFTVGQ